MVTVETVELDIFIELLLNGIVSRILMSSTIHISIFLIFLLK